jgi:hypothetical protein
MNLHILFGIAKNGGNDIYINNLLNDKLFREDKIKIIGVDKIFDVKDLQHYYNEQSFIRQSLFERTIRALVFFSKKHEYDIIYLSNSILVVLLGIIQIIRPVKNKIKWIAQGCEIYIRNKPIYKFNLIVLRHFQKRLNLEIISLNLYLTKWLETNCFKNIIYHPVDKLSEFRIVSDMNKQQNNKENDLILILRKEKCKGSYIGNNILKTIHEKMQKKIIVVDMHNQYSNEKWAQKVIYMNQIPHEKLIGLFKMTKFMVYPSFFEGYGLSIFEALSEDCIPIIGPENILFNQTEIPLVRAESNNPRDYIKAINKILQEN